jgi:hypothetical protein
MFRIRDILVRIRIPGFVYLTYGSGSCSFVADFQDAKKKFFSYFVMLITFCGYVIFTSVFKDKKFTKKSLKSGNQGFY